LRHSASNKHFQLGRERKTICLSKPFSLAEFRVAIDRALAGG
jgi:hypothetical protein